MFSLQHNERYIQPPIVIDEELQSVLDDLSSIADATSTHSLSFNLPTATEDPPSIQDQHCRTVVSDQSGEIDSGLSTAASFHTNPKDRSGTALGAMANPDIYTENELFSTVGCNVENVPRPELQQNIVPGYTSHRGTSPVPPNSIQICDGSASRSEFQERISHGGNTPRLQLQNFSQSVISTKFHGGNAPGPSNSVKIQGGNAPGPSNSAKIHGGNAPEPSTSNQVGGSRASSKVGATALTSSAILKPADKIMQNRL